MPGRYARHSRPPAKIASSRNDRANLMQAAIYGLAAPELSDDERRFFLDAEPAGFILFRRNCENPEQLLRLTDSLRELTGRGDLPILIDQEGGRVARMRPPEWPA